MGIVLTMRSPGGSNLQTNVAAGSELHRNLHMAGYAPVSYVDTRDPNRTVHYRPGEEPAQERAESVPVPEDVPEDDEGGR